jgi:hypothetical protein
MKIREKMVRAELAAANLGIREVGPNNHGPEVKKFLAEVGLPEGYAWCDAFQSYEEHAAAGHRLPIESAGVYATFLKAREIGWLVPATADPARGDLVLYDFDGDGQADDHIGIVTRASRTFGGWKLNTVEGNTGGGSIADGDGVYVRTRIVKRSGVAFVRIPGYVADPPAPKPLRVVLAPRKKSAKKPAPKKAPVKRRYYTHKRSVPLKKGETVGYVKGRGYYARRAP